MKDITKFKLRRLCEQALRLIREDDEIGEELIVLTVSKEGYMDFATHCVGKDSYCETRLPSENAWKDFSTPGVPMTVTEHYKCFNCRLSGAMASDGTMLCKKHMCDVEYDAKACNEFKDNFYINASFYDGGQK